MSIRRSLTSLGLVLVAAACAENLSAPATVEQTPHFLRLESTTQPSYSSLGAASERLVPFTGSAASLNDLALTSYQVSFWAVRGQSRSIQINYMGDGGTHPFLKLTTTDPKYVPGRGWLAQGDSVLVTATVDPNVIAVDFQPSGLRFGTPAEVTIWYGGAVGDLNGDGVVDGADAVIENQLLGMWYQADPSSPWSPIPATHSVSTKSFTAALEHFSGYSVAW